MNINAKIRQSKKVVFANDEMELDVSDCKTLKEIMRKAGLVGWYKKVLQTDTQAHYRLNESRNFVIFFFE